MHKAESARGLPKGLTCPNCDKLMKVTYEFETILLCRVCYDIADRLVTTCKEDLNKTLEVYKRILVAAIGEKKLHLQNAEAKEAPPMHHQV
jgi:hypothetical protein